MWNLEPRARLETLTWGVPVPQTGPLTLETRFRALGPGTNPAVAPLAQTAKINAPRLAYAPGLFPQFCSLTPASNAHRNPIGISEQSLETRVGDQAVARPDRNVCSVESSSNNRYQKRAYEAGRLAHARAHRCIYVNICIKKYSSHKQLFASALTSVLLAYVLCLCR